MHGYDRASVHNSSLPLPCCSHLRRPDALAEHSLELRAMGWNGVDDSGSEATASPAAAPRAWAALDDSSGAESGAEGGLLSTAAAGAAAMNPFIAQTEALAGHAKRNG